MYDFKDKKGVSTLSSILKDTYIYNKDYIPFSMLFNLNFLGTNYQVDSTITNRLKTYENDTLRKVTTLQVADLGNQLKLWIDDSPCVINMSRNHSRELISKFYESVTSSLFFKPTNVRNTKNYYTGYYTLFEQNLTKFYFVLMVKREYIKYVKLCVLLNEPILEDCFEFWYDEALILEENDLKVKRVTNKILKELNLIDVPCINKENILNLLQPEIKFNAPSISKQKELINEFVETFQKFELSKVQPF